MKTKKYQIGGSTQSRTSSDELNPFKIKEPIAPNPSFVPSGTMDYMKKGGSFPDLTGDGKVTFKDILKGRGVIKKKGGQVKKSKKY